MAEYIKKSIAIAIVSDSADMYPFEKNEAIRRIVDSTPADVAPVVHGKWGTDRFGMERSVCSICRATYVGGDFWNYCPKCGAKMDLK